MSCRLAASCDSAIRQVRTYCPPSKGWEISICRSSAERAPTPAYTAETARRFCALACGE